MGIRIAQIFPHTPEFEVVIEKLQSIYNYGLFEYDDPDSPWQEIARSHGWKKDFNRYLNKFLMGKAYVDSRYFHPRPADLDSNVYFAAYALIPQGEQIVGVVCLEFVEELSITKIHYLIANPFTSGAGDALLEHVVNLRPGYSVHLDAGDGTDAYYMRLGFKLNNPKLHSSYQLDYPPPPPWQRNADGRYVIRY